MSTVAASWGGWESSADKRVRELYVLKKLDNRYTWAGGIVHAAIRGALTDIRRGLSVDSGRAIDRAHRVMRQDWEFSRQRRYWSDRCRPEFSGLVEHEYEEQVPDEAWKANWENVRGALEWFFRSRWMALARSLSPEQWLEVDELDFDKSAFPLEGVKVWAVPDFAYRDDGGVPVVVDWKTGRARDGYDAQVLGYALYLQARYGLPASATRANVVYLNEGAEQAVRIDEASIAGFREHFQQSVARMRELLADPSANVPKPESCFPWAGDLGACGRCVFRRACDRGAPTASR